MSSSSSSAVVAKMTSFPRVGKLSGTTKKKTEKCRVKMFLPKFPKPDRFKIYHSTNRKKNPQSRLMTKEIKKMTAVIGQSSTTFKKQSMGNKLTTSRNRENRIPTILDSNAATNTAATITSTITTIPLKSTKMTKFVMIKEDSNDRNEIIEKDIAPLLCLVPLDLQDKRSNSSSSTSYSSIIATPVPISNCYWPCLVFSGLNKAMTCHQKLYPNQKKVQKRLRDKFMASMKASTGSKNDENRVVVLPLRDGSGCCPIEICKYGNRPLYDIVDVVLSMTKRTGTKVIRVVEDVLIIGEYLTQLKKTISVVPALEGAILEMERLLSLDDDDDDYNSISSSLKRLRNNDATEDEELERPIKFTRYNSKSTGRTRTKNNTGSIETTKFREISVPKRRTSYSTITNTNSIDDSAGLVVSEEEKKNPRRLDESTTTTTTNNETKGIDETNQLPADTLTTMNDLANKLEMEACNKGAATVEGQDKQEAIKPRQLMVEEVEEGGTNDGSPLNSNLAIDSTSSQSLVEGSKKSFKGKTLPVVLDSDIQHESRPDAEVDENNNTILNIKSNTEHVNEDDKYETNTSFDSISVKPAENYDHNPEIAPAAASEPIAMNGQLVSREDNITVVEESFMEEVDLQGTTNEEKLKACLKNLNNNELVASGQLSTSIAHIQNFIDAVIESKGKTGDESNNFPILFICGAPGTGKSMSTKRICEQAISTKTSNINTREKAPQLCHLNCTSLKNSSTETGIQNVLNRMGTKEAHLKRSPNDAKNAATILILDEVDQLIGKKGTERILSELFKWSKDENNVLSVIGISNAIWNEKTTRLQEYGLGLASNKLVFEAYAKKDLMEITQSKIGFSVVDKKAHAFIAAKIANSCGDARKYLELVIKAVQNCLGKLSLEIRDTVHTKPIVMIRDAMLAIRETNHSSKKIIESLPTYEKMTLCAGVHLARKLRGNPTTFGTLRMLTIEAFGMDSDFSMEDFKGVIGRLEDSGLLKLAGTDRRGLAGISGSSLVNYPVKFDLQLEDVDSALENTVMKDNFYKRMVDRVNNMQC